jgi:excisionase family DNA binding protein
MDKLLLRVEEAQDVLGLGRTKVYELVASGQLRSVHIGRSVRIPASALIDFAGALDVMGEV